MDTNSPALKLGADIGIRTGAGIEVLVARGTRVPHRFRDKFWAQADRQQGAQLEVLVRDDDLWRAVLDLHLENVGSVREGMRRIDLEFVIDEEGCLVVHADGKGTEPALHATVPGLPIAGIRRRRPRTIAGFNAALRALIARPFEELAQLSPEALRRLGLEVAACEVPDDLPDVRYLEATRARDAFLFLAQELARACTTRRRSTTEHRRARARRYYEEGLHHLARALRSPPSEERATSARATSGPTAHDGQIRTARMRRSRGSRSRE